MMQYKSGVMHLLKHDTAGCGAGLKCYTLGCNTGIEMQ